MNKGEASRQVLLVSDASPDPEALENLRAYILFLEEAAAKYLLKHVVECGQDRRVRRTIEAAFADDVESVEEGS